MEDYVVLCIAYMSSMYSPTFINVKWELSFTLNNTGLRKLEMVVLVTRTHKNEMVLTLKRKIFENDYEC